MSRSPKPNRSPKNTSTSPQSNSPPISVSPSPTLTPTGSFSSLKDSYIINFQDWTQDDVKSWLCIMGYRKYSETFIRNKIDGYDLVRITRNDLKDLGVIGIDVRRLFRDIAMLMYVEFQKKPKPVIVEDTPSETIQTVVPLERRPSRDGTMKQFVHFLSFKKK